MSPLPPLVVWSLAIPSFLFALYYGRRASKESRYLGLAFVMVIVYALVIEAADIREIHSYFYQKVLIMVGSSPDWVPLSICASWASLIYIAMKTSDRLALPWGLRPLVDGMFAVAIDVVADPVISNSRVVTSLAEGCEAQTSATFGGIGVWTWCIPESSPSAWMSVPIGNFVGWFLVVFAISLAIRVGRRALGAEEKGVVGQIAILTVVGAASAALVFAGIRLYMSVEAAWWSWTWFAALFVVPVGVLVAYRRRLVLDHPLDKGLVVMPILSHLGSLYTFFSYGIDRDRWPAWGVLMVVTAAFSVLLVLLPYLGRRRGAGQGTASTAS